MTKAIIVIDNYTFLITIITTFKSHQNITLLDGLMILENFDYNSKVAYVNDICEGRPM